LSALIGAASNGGNIGSDQSISSRVTTAYVGGATPDFSTIDAAVDAAIDGDTIIVAPGTYNESVTIVGKEITLTGEESSTTIINASGESFGLSLSNVDNSTISGFTIQAADRSNLYVGNGSDNNDFSDLVLTGFSSFSDSFVATINPYTYLGNDYDGTSGGGPGVMVLLDGTFDGLYEIDEASQDITAVIEDPPQTWNIALAEIDGAYATFLVNDSSYPNFTDISDLFGIIPMVVTERCWMDDVLVYSGGAYVFTPLTGCPSEDPTNTTIPEILSGNIGASLEIASSNGNSIYDSTISNNILGVRFTGTAENNEIYQGASGTTFEANTDEIISSSSGDNIIKDIEIDYDGVSATGAGNVEMYYKIRGYVTLDGSPVEGASVTVSNSSAAIVFTGTTDASGYTSYSTDLPAEHITSLGQVSTGNPHTYSVIHNSTEIASGSFSFGTESSTVIMAGVTAVVASPVQSSGSAGGGSSTESTEADPAVQETVEEPVVEDAQVPEPVVTPSNDQNALDVAINQFDGQLDEVISEPEENNVSLIDEEELLEAIAEFDTDEEVPEPEVEKTEEELVVEEALLEDTDDKEVLEKAEEVVSDAVSDSLEKALESAGEDGVNIRQDNQDFKISSLDEIEIVLGVGKDSDEINTAKKKAKESGKELIVIDEKSNIDDDDVSDVYQLTHGLPLFDKNPDNDAFDTADEIFLGLNPLKADKLPDKTAVTNLKNKISGDLPSFRMIGLPPGGKVELFAVKKESLTAEQVPGSVMMTNVLASIAPDSEQIKIGETIIDEKNKGEIKAETPLENGEYYLIPKDQNGLGEVSSFTVDNKQAPKIESLEVVSKDAIGGGIKSSLQTVSVFFAFDYEAYINEKIEETGVDRDTVIVRGEATPGSTVFVTWKSLIISSVVVSDASQGAFELEVPKRLAAGEHDVVTYAYNEKENAVSSASWLFFLK
jgi:hypothetical protein